VIRRLPERGSSGCCIVFEGKRYYAKGVGKGVVGEIVRRRGIGTGTERGKR